MQQIYQMICVYKLKTDKTLFTSKIKPGKAVLLNNILMCTLVITSVSGPNIADGKATLYLAFKSQYLFTVVLKLVTDA